MFQLPLLELTPLGPKPHPPPLWPRCPSWKAAGQPPALQCTLLQVTLPQSSRPGTMQRWAEQCCGLSLWSLPPPHPWGWLWSHLHGADMSNHSKKKTVTHPWRSPWRCVVSVLSKSHLPPLCRRIPAEELRGWRASWTRYAPGPLLALRVPLGKTRACGTRTPTWKGQEQHNWKSNSQSGD